MKKRSLLLIMVTVLLVSSVMGGCSIRERNALTIGQWLGMINEAFGMTSYAQDEPYMSNIDADNEYFNTIQIAAEWDVIDVSKPINPNDTLKWKDALVTLVNVGDFTQHNASNDEKIQYAIEHFDEKIRTYWMDREIDVASATKLLVEAQEQWANRTYEESIANVVYADGVVEIRDNGTEQYKVIEDDIVLMTEDMAEQFAVGDVFVLPNTGEDATPKAYKVEEIKVENGVAKIVTDTKLELGDFVDELYIQDTYTPDLTEATIYDGNGNLLQAGDTVIPLTSKVSDEYTITNLAYNGDSMQNVAQLAAKTTFEFEVDDCKVELTKTSDGLSAKIEMPLSKDKKTKGYYEVEVSDFKVTNKIDYSWFTLHSAELKVDYKTKCTGGVKRNFVDEKAVYAPKWSNGNGKFLSNLKRSVWKDVSSEKLGAKSIRIGSITVASVGVASFKVDIYAKLKVDGSVEITCTEVGCKGIEYKKGTCRVINTLDKDTDVKLKCKAEATVSVAPKVDAFGIAIIGLSAEVGLGGEVSLTMHLADAGNHLLEEMTITDLPPEAVAAMSVEGLAADAEEIKKMAEAQGGTFECETSTVNLHLDTCVDINIYFILRVGVDEETLAGELLKGSKVKITWEIFGSKNAKICNLHIENFDFATAFSKIAFFTSEDQCTLKYVPFDNITEEETIEEVKDSESGSVEMGEILVISDMKVIMQTGTCKPISVVQVPNGYELKDVICESLDTKIATIDKNGVITAGEAGSTTIVVKTKDGKYSCACAVTILDGEQEKFTPLHNL